MRSGAMRTSKITTKGQVTIPQELRRLLGVMPGDKISFEARDDGQVVIKKIDGRVSLAGKLKNQISERASDRDIDRAIKQTWRHSGSN